MKKEYKILGGSSFSKYDLEKRVNELLGEGWEIMQITDSEELLIHLFREDNDNDN
ncbi:hypothetical protein [Nitrospira sp. BLG_2]|uniref:hypothetical protein n=1 Tax=Nitrospira sp. BLG_2 TaxID=3397507 RepID=UPI003B9D5AC6